MSVEGRSLVIMKRIFGTAVVSTLAMMLTSCSLAAQDEYRAGDGFWWGVGGGAGVGKVACSLCNAGHKIAPTAQLRLGGVLGRTFLFGLEANGFYRTGRDEDGNAALREVMGGAAAVLYWYPNPAGGRYFFKGGFGPFFYRLSEANVPSDQEAAPPISSTAFSGHFGVGYELPVTSAIMFVPYINFTGTAYANLTRDESTVADANFTFIQVGLGFTWR